MSMMSSLDRVDCSACSVVIILQSFTGSRTFAGQISDFRIWSRGSERADVIQHFCNSGALTSTAGATLAAAGWVTRHRELPFTIRPEAILGRPPLSRDEPR